MEIKFTVFSLVKELKKDPESIAKLLQEKLFKGFNTTYEKGIIKINIPDEKKEG